MANALGDKRILFLANHGVIIAGPTVAHAFNDLYYLESVYGPDCGHVFRRPAQKNFRMLRRTLTSRCKR